MRRLLAQDIECQNTREAWMLTPSKPLTRHYLHVRELNCRSKLARKGETGGRVFGGCLPVTSRHRQLQGFD